MKLSRDASPRSNRKPPAIAWCSITFASNAATSIEAFQAISGPLFSTEFELPYSIQFSIGVQRELPWDLVVQADNLTTGDNSIDNFRFNPGYQPDLIFWRDIMGQVTDAWYVRPSLRVDMVGGLAWDLWAVYSQSLTKSSSPSTDPETGVNGSIMLGIEGETREHLARSLAAWRRLSRALEE